MDSNCNAIEQEARQALLDSWYEQDGRHDPAHPDHCLYTGLAEKYGQRACAGDGCPCSVEP